MVTDAELAAVMPRLPAAKRAAYLPHLQQAMREFRIEGRLREAAFLAQLAHESAELRYFEELASGAAYEGRRDLGNTQPGDGRRYKGRGPIQLTGRANYALFGRLLGLDLVGHPELAATPEVGFRVAGLFWLRHGLNERADRQDFWGITRAINGGTNGLKDRQRYYRRALAVLSDRDVPGGITVVVDGREVSDAGLFRGNAAWLPLRATAEALGWHVAALVGTNGTREAVISRGDLRRELPFQISGDTGYVPAAELAEAVGAVKTWDPEDRTVTLTLAGG